MWGTDASALRAAHQPYLSAIRLKSSGGMEWWNIASPIPLTITATPATATRVVANPTIGSYCWETGVKGYYLEILRRQFLAHLAISGIRHLPASTPAL